MEPPIVSNTSPSIPLEDPVRQLVEFGPDMMMVLRSDGRCRFASPASLSVLGRPPGSLSGVDLRELVLEADRHLLEDALAELRTGAAVSLTALRIYGAYGTCVWMEAHARRLPAGAGIVVVFRDIGARKDEEAVLVEANDLLRRRATLDPVTCLPNRGHFFATLERECRRAQREGTAIALLAISVDEMRLFNDFYGRDAGDVALREVAVAVEAALCRPGDMVGRLEGATLGVALPNTAAEGAANVADRLRQALAALELEHAGAPSGRLSVTVGLACHASRAKADKLLRHVLCEVEVARAAANASV